MNLTNNSILQLSQGGIKRLSMVVKLTDETVGALEAPKNASEANAKISALITENQSLKTNMSEQTTNLAALITRIEALEKGILTEAKAAELVATAVKAGNADLMLSVKAEAAAEASKMTAAALASVGTTPVKPAPAPAVPAALDSKTFPEIVQASMASGKSKTEAITASIESHPKEYKQYLQTGGNL